MEKQNIVLIGMPGAGKSTLGVVLAKAAGMQFIDTDLLIQQKTGERLQDTIDKKGLDAFLEIEEEVISSLCLSGYVIATGGSAVMSLKAMENLQRIGRIVYLDVPLDEIKQRLDNITTRGIAMHKGESIDTVFQKRLPLYLKYADITVSAANSHFEQTVEKILKEL